MSEVVLADLLYLLDAVAVGRVADDDFESVGVEVTQLLVHPLLLDEVSELLGELEGDLEVELGAHSDLTVDINRTVHSLDEFLANAEAESGSSEVAGNGFVCLTEGLE